MDQSRSRFFIWLTPLVYFSNNPLSLAGVVLVTSATILWMFLIPSFLVGTTENPYAGLLIFLTLPAIFIGGLLLIPLGIILRRRNLIRKGIQPKLFPPIDLRNLEFKRLLAFVAATTIVNVALASQLTYSAIGYMESVEFCGQTCHTVMAPEYTAYKNSPHSRVECVKCHIGPGAGWFVKSKLSGVGQVVAVTLHNYPTPIPTPVRNLRPARETCEACHWPQKFGGDRLRQVHSYAEDESNTHTQTALLMRIGGGDQMGIHGMHMAPGVQIRYAPADEARQSIPVVEYTRGDGKWTRFAVQGAPATDRENMRVMDCMDCHNRPSHSLELPDRALNRVIASGAIPATLPWAKKRGLELLKGTYKTQEEAAPQITAGFENFYKEKYPEIYASRRAEITRAAAAVAGIYKRNVFPEMKITWGSYPNNLGHNDFPGCFRCHDDLHVASTGDKITQDCSACHSLLAMDEAAPKILTDLGVK